MATREIKKLHLFITRYITSSSACRRQAVQGSFRTLIERVEWIVGIAGDFCERFRSSSNLELAGVALELKAYLASMQTVAANARRANVAGATVPANERVFSLFEPHTELIKRGRREKPVEFGHKVLLCETAEKFITDYEVYEQQQPDCELTRPVIERHEKLFGERPVVLAADKGLCPEKSKFEELAKLVANLAIPRRMQDFMDKLLASCQAFRAGIEGQRVAQAERKARRRFSREERAKIARTVWRDAGAVKADRIRLSFIRIANSAGLAGATCPKSWRHSFAALLQDANVDPLIRQITLGHAPTGAAGDALGMTSIYTHTRPETQRREILRALRLWPRSLGLACRFAEETVSGPNQR